MRRTKRREWCGPKERVLGHQRDGRDNREQRTNASDKREGDSDIKMNYQMVKSKGHSGQRELATTHSSGVEYELRQGGEEGAVEEDQGWEGEPGISVLEEGIYQEAVPAVVEVVAQVVEEETGVVVELEEGEEEVEGTLDMAQLDEEFKQLVREGAAERGSQHRSRPGTVAPRYSGTSASLPGHEIVQLPHLPRSRSDLGTPSARGLGAVSAPGTTKPWSRSSSPLPLAP